MVEGELLAGRYRIEHKAGAGGMGTVYRALDQATGLPVALKVLTSIGPRQRERFAREGAMLAELRHPGIATYWDHGVLATGEPFLAMEWVEGETLAARLRQGPLELREALEVGSRVAAALGFAHRAGVVHRDVKPSNIMLVGNPERDVKLIDFGIARRQIESVDLTTTGAVVGTVLYCAPEQARDSKAVTAAADVYSLGTVLYECITGTAAFGGGDLTAVLARVVFAETPRLSSLRPEIPAAADELIAQMMDKDPAMRPVDGHAARTELERVARGSSDGPERSSPSLTAVERRLVWALLATGLPVSAGGYETGTQADLTGASERWSSLRRTAERYGGLVRLLANGAALVLFGDVATGQDEHEVAARCALAWRACHPTLRLALAAGPAVLGSDVLVGEVLDRAAAALARCAPGTIRLEPAAADVLERRFLVAHDDAGGELQAPRPAPTDGGEIRAHRTPCVGRARELSLLQGTLEECCYERVARAVVITGEAGIGKSRLVEELITHAETRGLRKLVLPGRADWAVAGAPFVVAADLVRRWAGLDRRQSGDDERQALRNRIEALGIAPGRVRAVAEFLGEVAGLAPSAEAGEILRAAREDAVLMGDQIRAAWEDWLAALCDAVPVLLVLEDLQFADAPSVALIDAALRHCAERPLMVLATARPEVRTELPDLWAARHAQQLALGPLTKKASVDMLAQLSRGQAGAAVLGAVAQRSGGNPLFIEELARALLDQQSGDLPDSLLGMVQSRIQRLPAPTRRALRAAAVFGQTFWLEGLAALLALDPGDEELEQVVRDLRSAELVAASRPSRLVGQREYRFVHEPIREGAYAMLTDEDRVLGHRLAAQWLERVGEGDAALLGRHFEEGRDREHALPHLRRAAHQALEGNDLREAVVRAERAIALGAEGELRGDLLLVAAEAGLWLGEFDASASAAARAQDHLARGGPTWFRAISVNASAAFNRGEHARVAALLELAAGTTAWQDALPAQIQALCRIGSYAHHLGEAAASNRALEYAESLAREHQVDTPIALGWLAVLGSLKAFARGDLAGYVQQTSAAADAFDAAGNVRLSCSERINVAVGLASLGAYARARRLLEEVLVVVDRAGLAKTATSARLNLANVALQVSELAAARAVAEAALRDAQQIGVRRLEGVARLVLGAVAGRAGQHQMCEAELAQALELLAGTPSYRASALGELARLRLAQLRPAEALELVVEAERIGREVGGLGATERELDLWRATALQAMGRTADAAACVERAVGLVLEQASAVSDCSLRESYLRLVPAHGQLMAWAESLRG